MNAKNLIISIIIGLVIFALGGVCGFFYQQQREVPQIETQNAQDNSASKILSSKIISSIMASAEVSDIVGKNITLKSGDDSLTIKISDDALIYSFVVPANGKTPVRQTAKFEDIKKGDFINIKIKESSDKQIVGGEVTISLAQPVPTK